MSNEGSEFFYFSCSFYGKTLRSCLRLRDTVFRGNGKRKKDRKEATLRKELNFFASPPSLRTKKASWSRRWWNSRIIWEEEGGRRKKKEFLKFGGYGRRGDLCWIVFLPFFCKKTICLFCKDPDKLNCDKHSDFPPPSEEVINKKGTTMTAFCDRIISPPSSWIPHWEKKKKITNFLLLLFFTNLPPLDRCEKKGRSMSTREICQIKY